MTDLFLGGGLRPRPLHSVSESGWGGRLHLGGYHPVLLHFRGPRATQSWSMGVSLSFGLLGMGFNLHSSGAGSLCNAAAVSLCWKVCWQPRAVHLGREFFWTGSSVTAARCVLHINLWTMDKRLLIYSTLWVLFNYTRHVIVSRISSYYLQGAH